MRASQIGSLLTAALLIAGCDEHSRDGKRTAAAAVEASWFEDITESSGIHFTHQVATSGSYLFSEAMGPGGAFLDFDNDGRLDVYLIHNVNTTNASASNRLFHQQADGRFKDASAGSGLDVAGYGNGLAVGDLNNDGRPEVLLTEYDRVRLFLNRGGGKFQDVTAPAGLTNHDWSVTAAFFDYDRDGWLDLVLGNYLDYDPTQKCFNARGQPEFCGPHGFRSTVTRLFRNTGARRESDGAPRFEDVTIASGFARAPGKAMQIACADFDGDHWPDVFITDDGLPNRLFVNQRDGTFKEEGVQRGVGYTGMGTTAANMGIALGDVDQDGLFDLFVPHLAEENHTLWRQVQRGLFRDDTARAGLLNVPWHGTGFAAIFADFDCNAALDLAVANGAIRRHLDRTPPKLMAGIMPFWASYAEPSQIFANEGGGRFREVSSANPQLCGEALVGRGLLCGDIDNDGGSDLLIIGVGGPARVLRNAAVRGHWLGIRAVVPTLGDRDAYGAEIVVRAGNRRWWGLVQPAYGYASSNDPRVHFGLGSVAAIDSIDVLWPDGTAERFPGGAPNRYVLLRQGGGQVMTTRQ